MSILLHVAFQKWSYPIWFVYFMENPPKVRMIFCGSPITPPKKLEVALRQVFVATSSISPVLRGEKQMQELCRGPPRRGNLVKGTAGIVAGKLASPWKVMEHDNLEWVEVS